MTYALKIKALSALVKVGNTSMSFLSFKRPENDFSAVSVDNELSVLWERVENEK